MNHSPRNTLRTLLFGLLTGLLAAALRAPRGLDLIQTAAVAPRTASALRAAALCAIGLGILWARRALPTPLPVAILLIGSALGYAAGGLVADAWLEPSGVLSMLVIGGLGSLAMLSLGGPLGRDEEIVPDSETPSLLETSGIALAGGGAAFALEGLARWVRLFGPDRAVDDAVYGATFLLATMIGALCFRDLVRGLVRRLGRAESRVPLAAGLSLAAAACIPAIWFLADIASPHGLEAYVGSFGLNREDHGTLAFAALIGARGFALPALCLGAALTAAHHRTELAGMVLGAALGTAVTPWIWELLIERATSDAAVATTLASTGACLALAGAFVTTLGRHGRPARVRLVALIPALAVISLVIFVPRPAWLPTSPWGKFQPHQFLALQDSAGYLSVESAQGFSSVLTVDRRRVTPLSEELAADELRLELSMGLLAADIEAPSVLFVGQLTPSRWWTLRSSGVGEVDRTAAWWRSMGPIEDELFSEYGRPPGAILDPEDVWARLDRGQYDLVLIPPTTGLAPVVPDLELHENTVCVLWLDARELAAQRSWGDEVLWASDGLLESSIGIVRGPWTPSRKRPLDLGDGELTPDEDGVRATRFDSAVASLAMRPAGGPRLRPMGAKLLHRTEFLHRRDSTVACAERLVSGATNAVESEIAEVLRASFAAQQKSFWQTRLGDLELDLDGLARLRDATLQSAPLDASLAALWEGLARTLVDQREIEAIQELLGPLAQAHAFWPELELALAHSDLEFNDPGDAARRLVGLTRTDPLDIELRLRAANALAQAGKHVEAATQLREADALQPGRRDVRRELAMAMVRAGQAGGRSLVRELLEEDPEDLDLQSFLGAGPFPPVPSQFLYGSEHEGHDHGPIRSIGATDSASPDTDHDDHGHDP